MFDKLKGVLGLKKSEAPARVENQFTLDAAEQSGALSVADADALICVWLTGTQGICHGNRSPLCYCLLLKYHSILHMSSVC